ncbi:Protein of unknown function [Bacillus toyonensis]|nr:Protein of unknown function [Bacillus toyonensis]
MMHAGRLRQQTLNTK